MRVSAPEEPDMALARGAALASANAPLFASSTAARAYAQDPSTGYIEGTDSAGTELAYSAVPDDLAEAYTGEHTAATDFVNADYRERRSFGLVGSVLASIFIVG